MARAPAPNPTPYRPDNSSCRPTPPPPTACPPRHCRYSSHNAAPLLKQDNARIHTIIEFMPTLLDWDADMAVLGQLTDPLLKPEVVAPLLRVVEMASVAEALASAEEGASPLAFGGALLVEGTLQSLLLLMDDMLELTQP